jgi:hypothetical protein
MSSRATCNRFASSVPLNTLIPVAFPPGLLKLSTRPSRTGSPPAVNTIGMLAVAAFAARGDRCDGSFSETASLQSVGRFCVFFSGPEIPFPGNGDRERQRLGSNAGYAEGSPSIWCCRDHSAGMSARRATPMP